MPLIFWSILGFVSLIPAPHICFRFFGCISIVSILAVIAVTVFYFRLSWRIALLMLLIMILLEHFVYQINIALERNSWTVFVAVFVLSWIGQFFGHKIEGKKPSFLKDLQFLLVGPVWLLHFILKKSKIRY